MAKIDTIDVVTGIHGKYGSDTKDYFATNTCSGKIHLAKLKNPYDGPATAKQLTQRSKFKIMARFAAAWLNANKPLYDADGNVTREASAAYLEVQRLRKLYSKSNIRQVVIKYMDTTTGVVTLPASGASQADSANSGNTGDSGANSGSQPRFYTLSISSEDTSKGTVNSSVNGQKTAGSTVTITATAASEAYRFDRWNDGNTNATRVLTMDKDYTLVASFRDYDESIDGTDTGDNDVI